MRLRAVAVVGVLLGGCGSATQSSGTVEPQSAPEPPVVVESRIVTEPIVIAGDDLASDGDPGPPPSDELTWDETVQGWVGEVSVLEFVVEASQDTDHSYCLPFPEDGALQPHEDLEFPSGQGMLHCIDAVEAEGTVRFLLSDFDVRADELVDAELQLVTAKFVAVDGRFTTVASEPSHPVQVIDHR